MIELEEMIAKGIPDEIQEEQCQEKVLVNTTNESPNVEVEQIIEFPTSDFSTWFNKHCNKFSDVRVVKASISGIDSLDNIIITIPTSEKDSSGETKRKIKIFENAKQMKVLDADPISFHVYNNGYMIIYRISDYIVAKGYGVKTGMFLTICGQVDNLYVPFKMMKLTKKDTVAKIPITNSITSDRLNSDVDIESLQILYSQITKYSNQIKTKKDMLSWFATKQVEVEDVNHHLQIDEVLLKTI
jgi:hypothetical protein